MPRSAAFAKDRTGSIAVLSALSGVVLVGFTALAVDGASLFLAKRRQQAATDLAAIAGAAGLDQASARVPAIMAANGFGAATLEISTGSYTADPTRAPDARFSAGAGSNAVRVSSTTIQPLVFGGALQALIGAARSLAGTPSGVTIKTQATARKQDVAAFTLGSSTASVDGGLLNAVLGGLLGTRLSLSLLDYQSLGNATVDLFDFSDALAARLRLSGPTYGSVAAGLSTQTALFASLADILGDAAASAAVRSIAAALPTSATATLTPIVDFGPAASLAIGAPHPVGARISALDLVSALVRVCNGGHLASVDLGSSFPGLDGTRLLLAVGEPLQGSGFSAVGGEGASLHTAQVRLQMTTQIGGPALPAALTLPVYVDAAPASAALSAISCTNPAQPGVTLAAATGLASAAIGTVAPADMATFGTSPAVMPATILDLATVLRVTATAQASLTSAGSLPILFTATDIRARTQKSISSQLSLAALLGSLAANTRLSVNVLGQAIPQPTFPASVMSAIANATAPIDAALERLLPILGITVGRATTTVTGVRCGQGILVN